MFCKNKTILYYLFLYTFKHRFVQKPMASAIVHRRHLDNHIEKNDRPEGRPLHCYICFEAKLCKGTYFEGSSSSAICTAFKAAPFRI